MSRVQIGAIGLVFFLVGFILTVVATASQNKHSMAVGGAVVMVIGVVALFYYILSGKNKKK